MGKPEEKLVDIRTLNFSSAFGKKALDSRSFGTKGTMNESRGTIRIRNESSFEEASQC
jgi:hypothetical protein